MRLLALALLFACAQALAADCYPGVKPTTANPQVAFPSDEPYVTWRTWGAGSYWYCMDPATGKWKALYSIAVASDIAALLTSSETLDSLLRASKVQFDSAATPDAKRAVLDALVARFSNTSWQSCTNAKAQHLSPYEGYCLDIEKIACGPTTPNGQRCNAMPPDQVPAGSQVWKVKASGTSTTRVVYTTQMVGGKLVRGPLTNPTKYVDVGTVCDQSIRVDEPLGPLTATYMGVPGGIAVCAP